jgi:ABC-type oligopeptide transport system substrate-binding subunit
VANSEYVKHLKQGPDAWNKYREENIDIYISQRPDFIEANLKGANLREAYLEKANLTEAYLGKANLKKANLKKANLREANLRGATNLTIDQLSTVKTLYKVVGLDSTLFEQVRENYPHLLEKP